MSSRDPIMLLARQRMVKLSAELEVQLADKEGGAPAIEICRRFRERAVEALAAIAFLNIFDAEDRKKYITLQNEIKRYDEWLADMRSIVSEGVAYDAEMRDEERSELLDLLAQQPDGERQAIELGLVEPPQE